jgi:hypothetical protein
MCQLILMGITISTTTLWKLKWLRAYYGTAQTIRQLILVVQIRWILVPDLSGNEGDFRVYQLH